MVDSIKIGFPRCREILVTGILLACCFPLLAQPPDSPTSLRELGRFLFYDTRLSRNNLIACASCHKQEFAFADTARFSRGLDGLPTLRNSMAAFNTAFHVGGFFWDLRAPTLEEQVLMPIQDVREMDMRLDSLTARLARTALYPPLFSDAFGDPELSPDRLARALAGFLRGIISDRSRYDAGLRNGFSDFTDQERLGMDLFTRFADPNATPRGANCFLCHSHVVQKGVALPANFTSNGLDQFPTDAGVGAVTGQPEHHGTFKIPTVRNIALTAPYMHDGRFQTLEEVVEHYDQHLQPHANLDPILRDLGNVRPGYLDLSASEKAALVAFLHTFTDTALTTDPQYANPFTSLGLREQPIAALPRLFVLGENFPNPFNGQTEMVLTVLRTAQIRVSILDILGREVRILKEGTLSAGRHQLRWDGTDNQGMALSGGIYFCRALSLESNPGATAPQVKKVVLLK
ncbi:MAG TPA: cytochrome c peroxidase [Calditrichia bacterium]|nr:cytochrome c peroxidase [Calditrichia bacterium]